MQTHSFTIVLDGITDLDDDLADRIYEAGCDDSLLHSTGPVVMVSFDREAETYEAAVEDAKTDLRKAGCVPGTVTKGDW